MKKDDIEKLKIICGNNLESLLIWKLFRAIHITHFFQSRYTSPWDEIV